MLNDFPAKPEAQVTLANWRQAPFNAWAFHHVREIVPSADIGHDPSGVRALDGGASLDAKALGLAQFVDAEHVDGLVVLHQGKIVFEHYGNGMVDSDPHILMSISKSMLGLLAGILKDQGLIDLSATAETYVPELKDTAFAGATLHQLLDMRSGITFNEDYELTEGPIVDYRKSTNWNPLEPGETPTDLRSFLLTLKGQDGPHGGVFDYKSPCTDLLGWIIERATGAPYARVFSDLFWTRIGAEMPAYITVDRLGAPRCAGGMCMTTRDLARVGQLIVEGGAGVVPEDWINEIEREGDPDAWAAGGFAGDFPSIPMHYRAKWYVLREASPILMCIGIHGQNLLIDRQSDLVLARHSSVPKALDISGDLRTIDLFQRIREQFA